MTNKTPDKTLFCSFYVNFCTFCASLRLIRTSAISAFSAVKNSCLCVFCASLWSKRTVFNRPKTSIISVNPVILSNLSSCLRVFVAKTPRNLRLINDLRSTKDYVRKNKLFMQNKANFRKVKFNVTKVLTTDYDQLDTWSIRKNEPKTNPNSKRPK